MPLVFLIAPGTGKARLAATICLLLTVLFSRTVAAEDLRGQTQASAAGGSVASNCLATVPRPPSRAKAKTPPCCTPCAAEANKDKTASDANNTDMARAEFLVLLTRARGERDLGHWDKAAELYGQATKTALSRDLSPPSGAGQPGGLAPKAPPARLSDPLVCQGTRGADLNAIDPNNYALHARANFCHAQAQTGTWWWSWGAYFPPFRWCHTYPRRCIWFVAVVLFFILSPLILPQGRGALFWMTRVIGVFRPRLAQVTITTPQKLTASAETDLFAHALGNATAEILGLFDDPDLGAYTVTMRALPLTFSRVKLPSARASTKDLPTVKGLDVGSVVRLFGAMMQYFSWKLESALAFSPALKAEDGHPAAPPRMRAFANMRWAWYVGSSAEVDREVWDQYDVHGLAIAIAAELMRLGS